MVHHQKEFVDLLLEQLDDERNDIYMHIDSKCKEFCFEDFNYLKHAGIYKVEPINVNWGDYSQVECEYRLMKKAAKNGPYAYYHFIQGDSYPLKSQDKLHDFYDRNQGKLFISIDNETGIDRVMLKYFFIRRTVLIPTTPLDRFLKKVNTLLVEIQKKLNYNHFRRFNLVYKKGFSLWSIPDDFLRYLLSKEKLVQKIFRHSYLCDEVYIQIMAYNSEFKERINFINEKYSSSMWYSTWFLEREKIRKGNCFLFEDIPLIIDSNCNFARKFSGKEGLAIINTLKKHIENDE